MDLFIGLITIAVACCICCFLCSNYITDETVTIIVTIFITIVLLGSQGVFWYCKKQSTQLYLEKYIISSVNTKENIGDIHNSLMQYASDTHYLIGSINTNLEDVNNEHVNLIYIEVNTTNALFNKKIRVTIDKRSLNI